LETITDDLELFLQLFEFDTKEENQVNSENIITREVKLRDRIQAFIEKLGVQVTAEELRRLYPFEELLKIAYDNAAEDDEEMQQLKSGKKSAKKVN